MDRVLDFRLAGLEDMEGVKALLRKYHRDSISDEDRPDGFVTTAITDEQLTELIEKERGVTVIAEPLEGGPDRILGFCFAAPWEFWEAWPLFRHMMDIIPDYEFEGKKIVFEGGEIRLMDGKRNPVTIKVREFERRPNAEFRRVMGYLGKAKK